MTATVLTAPPATTVPTVGTTTDGKERTEFNAVGWLSCATDLQITALTAIGFAGTVTWGVPAGTVWLIASIVDHYSGWSTADLLWHAQDQRVGYTITLDPAATAAWIAAHRPHLTPGAERVLTPVSGDRCYKTHATLYRDPCGERAVTLCGRTLRVTTVWAAGTFDRYALRARPNYLGGGCVQCADAAGLPRP